MKNAFTSSSYRNALSPPLLAGIVADKLLTIIQSLLLSGKPQRDRYLVVCTGEKS